MPKRGHTAEDAEKRRIERELAKSEARFRQIVEAAPNAMIMVGAGGRIELVNAETERVFGYARSELIGNTIETLLPERFRGHHPALRESFFDDPKSRPMGAGRDLFARRKDGSEVPVEIGLNALDMDGEAKVLATIVDISDRRRKLREVGYLAAIVESSDDPIIGKNLSGVITAWNPAAEKLLGYAAGEVIGRHISLLIPKDRLAEEDLILARIRRGEKVAQFETMRLAKGGREIAVSLTISPIRAVGGEIVGASKIVRDISERQRSAEKLRQSEERFQSIFDAISEGVFVADGASGSFVEINRPGAHMFGYTPDELVGHNIAYLSAGVPPYTRDDALQWLEKAVTTGRVQQFDWHCKAKDGRLFWAEVFLRDSFIGGRKVVLATARDVSERRAVEAQLRQAQKLEAVGLLTGGIAHDFNNMLAVVHGNLELIKERATGESDIVEMAADALSAADKGASLIRQLLAYSRQQALAPKVVDVADLVAGASQLLQRVFGETVDFRTAVAKDLWRIRIDPNQLENALVNLAINARDAMKDGGRLTIEATNKILDEDYGEQNPDVKPGPYVLLAVSDNGAGIPKDILERVFEPFFTTKPVGKGSGLGLSMVFGFVKQSGGHIKIYSEVGMGTTVNLYLPRADEGVDDRDAVGEADALPRGGADEVVLVLEDDEMVRKFAVRVLAGLGYRTITAGDGPEALRLLEQTERVDLLLTDVVLPKGLSGPAVAREAQVRRPDLRVLYMSGYAKDAVVNNGILQEGVQLLRKPFLKSELARAIREVLGEGHAVAKERLMVVDDDADFGSFVRRVAHKLNFEVEVATRGSAFMAAYERFAPTVVVLDIVMPDIDGIELIRWLIEKQSKARIVLISGFDAQYGKAAAALAELAGLASITRLTKPVATADLESALMSPSAA